MKILTQRAVSLVVLVLLFTKNELQAQTQTVHRNLPAIAARLQPLARLSASTNLQLAIGLPLRNQAALATLLQQIYDPASTNYHHYLTPQQFTAQFGPSARDYQKVIAFAKAHGLKVTATHSNRVLLDVTGSVANVEKALHVTMHVYQHPTENRTFYAPGTDPTLDLSVPIADVSGLNNFALPKPRLQAIARLPNVPTTTNAAPNLGSGTSGSYMGLDFRAAYAPGVTLDGTGQTVGLLQFDGYTASDISFYETQASLPNIPLQNVLLDGFGGAPTGNGGEVEVSLDIEMSISMATNLTKVIVYEAGPGGNWHDILNRMTTDNLAKQLSCSWYISGGVSDPVADGIFIEMAMQGQSFFNASGDFDAYTGLISFPGDSPYITQVGGTTLSTTGPGGSRTSEIVWNRGGGAGSGGGISTQYGLPSWQTNAITVPSHGSTTKRNTPDVALTSENVYVRANGQNLIEGGTSCAAPLWAGFTALVNQQAAFTSQPSVGFINPLVYQIGAGAGYAAAFHDITAGNNESPSSPNRFSAVTGYDLCTGWGTPNGQGLINALVNPEPLLVSPATGFTSIGGTGGPFSVNSQVYSLTNSGTNILNWSLVNTSIWLNASVTSGTLTPGGPATSVTIALNTVASNLLVGTYSATLSFSNLTDHIGQNRQFTLNVISPPTILTQPANQAVSDGATATFFVQATGGLPLAYQWKTNGINLTDGGNISGSTATNLIISNASTNNVATYTVTVTNFAGSITSSNALLSLTPSLPIIVSLSSNQTVYAGANLQFAVTAIGTKPFAYQWSVNTTNIAGVTNATLILTNLQVSQSGNYTVLITNIYGPTNSAAIVLTVNPIPLCAPEASGLISWWAGEANASDSFGTNNGTLVGGTTFTNGEVGQAFFFNGSDYVLIPDSPTLDSFTTNITVECWMKSSLLSANPNWMWMVTKGNNSWRVQGTTGASTMSFDVTGINSQIDLTGTHIVNDGQWHHVAAVYDGTNKYLYVDGTLDVSQPASGPIPQTTQPVELGENSQTDSSFQGALDEVSIYNQALTAAQIQQIYLTGQGGKCQPQFPPVITMQPVGLTNYVGSTATFGVGATGTIPLSYQWSINTTNITGATNVTLILTNLQLTQSGNYSVLVTNLYGHTNSAIAVLKVIPVPACTPPNPGLISWWAGEANASDSFGTNNGTLVGGTTFTNGEVGQAFFFNGSDYVLIPDSPTLDSFTTNITVECWMKSSLLSANPNWMWMVTKGNNSWRVQGTTGASTMSFDVTGINSQIDLTGTHIVNDGQWHHVAAVYDGTNKYLYVDGTLDVSQPASGPIPQTTQPVELGENSQTDSSFQGALDEVSIYNQALTAAQIQQIYLTGQGGKCQPQFPPVITMQPVGLTNYVGSTATFGVGATGTIPLSYQWSINTTNITGATNVTLILTNLQLTQSGNYSVLVTNLYGHTNSAIAVLKVIPVPACTPPNPGLISWWAGEANASDSFGTNNGTLVGGTTFTNGEVGQAFFFNGSDYVLIPDSPTLDSFTTNITVECWMKSSVSGNNPGWMWMVAKGNTSWRFMATTFNNTVTFSVDGASPAVDLFGSRNVNDGQWHHVAGVYDGTHMYIYVDGTLDVSQAATGAMIQNAQPVELGANSETVSAFQGALDEVSIYNQALTSAQIQQIYLTGHGGKCLAAPVIITQPSNQVVKVGGTATFNAPVFGSMPLTNQWYYLGMNHPIAGATNSTLILSNVQLTNAGVYFMTASNQVGSTVSSNALLMVYAQDHFHWSNIVSPRFVNIPFAAAIQAQDVSNSVVTNFTGTVILSSTSGVPVNPPVSANFIRGIWTGTITIAQPVTNLVLRADDGLGEFGLANPVNVVYPPTLGAQVSGSSLLIFWPVASPTFVLESSGSLSPAKWVQVLPGPLQIGGQNIQSLPLSQTNCFYRLLYSGQ